MGVCGLSPRMSRWARRPRSAHAAATAAVCALCSPPHVTCISIFSVYMHVAQQACCWQRLSDVCGNFMTCDKQQLCEHAWPAAQSARSYCQALVTAEENYHISHPRALKCWDQSIQLSKLVATQHRMQKIIMQDCDVSRWRIGCSISLDLRKGTSSVCTGIVQPYTEGEDIGAQDSHNSVGTFQHPFSCQQASYTAIKAVASLSRDETLAQIDELRSSFPWTTRVRRQYSAISQHTAQAGVHNTVKQCSFICVTTCRWRARTAHHAHDFRAVNSWCDRFDLCTRKKGCFEGDK